MRPRDARVPRRKGGDMAMAAGSRVATLVESTPAADPAPLGLGAFALTTFVLSGHNATFIPDLIWVGLALFRSEERRVGKECRSRWAPCHEKKRTKYTCDETYQGYTGCGRV